MSFKEPYEIRSLVKKADPRGSLFEILRFVDDEIPGQGYLYTFSILPGQRRGDHYHEKKHEWFTCTFGRATILIETSDGKKERIVLDAENPAVIYFAPGTAHALLNESDATAVIISYGSKQHDPEDPDTIKKFIEI